MTFSRPKNTQKNVFPYFVREEWIRKSALIRFVVAPDVLKKLILNWSKTYAFEKRPPSRAPLFLRKISTFKRKKGTKNNSPNVL